MNHRYIDSKLCLFENYKHLLTSESSLKTTQFKKNLSKMESQLQAARRVYNGDVTLYNTAISTFPNNVFAGIFGSKIFQSLLHIIPYCLNFLKQWS